MFRISDTPHTRRILVIDDDPTVRLLARATLEQEGFMVIEAADGEQALRCFQASEHDFPAMALLDIEMPGIDGFETCKRLRKIVDQATLPIVMITGSDDLESIGEAYKVGATDFISKPINWPILAHRAHYVLRGAESMRKLRCSQARNAALLAAIPDMIFSFDVDGTFINCKPGRAASLHVSREDLIGKTVDDIFPPAAAKRILKAIHKTIDSGKLQSVRYWLEDGDGRRHFEARLMLAGDDEVMGLIRDMTEHEDSQRIMREALLVFNASNQAIATINPDGTVTTANPAFFSITGYAPDQVIGFAAATFIPAWKDAVLFTEVRAVLEKSGAWEGELSAQRRSGESYPQWLAVSADRNQDGEILTYVAVFNDITERKRQEHAIWYQANFDSLTGLANRNLLHDRLERTMAHARRGGRNVGVMFIDLDGFKLINDGLGHSVGDKLLIEVARRLRQGAREEDTIARCGGDEFALIIDHCPLHDDLRTIAENVVKALQEPYWLEGCNHYLSASVGITVFPKDGADVQSLLKSADIAMYKAKQAGKNRFQFYSEEMHFDIQNRMQMEIDLRAAIGEDAFALHYQPIINGDGEVVGAEALLRWCSRERGSVSPLEFIPVAEDCGLIVPIGEWAIREAARQWREWHRKGYLHLHIAVNVSGIQFSEGNLQKVVAEAIEEYGLPRGALCLEITESILMEGSQVSKARLRDIKDLGVAYALDDFGTGFSSLSYLRQFPVDVVKIDRSFISDCLVNANDRFLVKAIINMAHSLGLQVTAEGVETTAQLNFLFEHECDFLQGWLISGPVAATEFETLVRRHSPMQACLWDRAEMSAKSDTGWRSAGMAAN